MASKPKRTPVIPPDPDVVQRAIAALLAADREERVSGGEPKTVEAVLAQIGLSASQVQGITGGNYETIKTRMRRAK
jgi:hypothetical protein